MSNSQFAPIFGGVLLLFLSISISTVSASADYHVALCNASFPLPRWHPTVLYDGNDTIHIIGGWVAPVTGPDANQTFSYSISQDRLEYTGSLPVFSAGGASVMDSRKNIYHITGHSNAEQVKIILQYLPDSRSFSPVSSLPEANYQFSVIQPEPSTVLLLGGHGDPSGIVKFNLSSLETERIGDLPREANATVQSAIWVEEDQAAYIFKMDGTVVKYYWPSGRYEALGKKYPELIYEPKAVFDGTFIYLLGVRSRELDTSSIIRFDRESGNATVANMVGDRGWTEDVVFLPGAVYVEKLNRIYLFGGITNNLDNERVTRDQIWFVDLNLDMK